MKTAEILALMLQYAVALQRLATLVNTANAQGRDVSDDELDQLAKEDDLIRQNFQANIDRTRG